MPENDDLSPSKLAGTLAESISIVTRSQSVNQLEEWSESELPLFAFLPTRLTLTRRWGHP